MFFSLDIQEIRHNKIYKVQVKCFTTIQEIKLSLQKHYNNLSCFPTDRMQLFHSSKTKALNNFTTLHEIGIDSEGFSLILSLNWNSNLNQYFIEPLKTLSNTTVQQTPLSSFSLLDEPCKDLISQIKEGFLSSNILPSKTDLLDCTGGVYFLKSANNQIISVFKPHDEEQGMPNNPKGYSGNGKLGNSLRPSFQPGEGYLREMAAYLVDFNHFHNVPSTCIVHCEHPSFNYPSSGTSSEGKIVKKAIFPKLGSLQQFIKATDLFEDISPTLISTLELQKIALLDMRILNCDRNSANILLIRKPMNAVTPTIIKQPRRDSRSGSMTSSNGGDDYDYDYEMDMQDFINRSISMELSSSRKHSAHHQNDLYECVPIDHGYAFPNKLLIDEIDWCWFHCPQIAQPIEPELINYMKSINIDVVINNLRKSLPLAEDCLFLLKIVHNLILSGMNQGLTLKDIASLIVRMEEGQASPLEKAIKTAEENASRAVAAHKEGLYFTSLAANSTNNNYSTNNSNNNNNSGALMSPQRRHYTKSPVSSIVNNVLPLTVGGNNHYSSNVNPAVLTNSKRTSPNRGAGVASFYYQNNSHSAEGSEYPSAKSVFPFKTNNSQSIDSSPSTIGNNSNNIHNNNNTNNNNNSINNNENNVNIRKPNFPQIQHPDKLNYSILSSETNLNSVSNYSVFEDEDELNSSNGNAAKKKNTKPSPPTKDSSNSSSDALLKEDELMKNFLLTSSYLRPKGQLTFLQTLEPIANSPLSSTSNSTSQHGGGQPPLPPPTRVMREISNTSSICSKELTGIQLMTSSTDSCTSTSYTNNPSPSLTVINDRASNTASLFSANTSGKLDNASISGNSYLYNSEVSTYEGSTSDSSSSSMESSNITSVMNHSSSGHNLLNHPFHHLCLKDAETQEQQPLQQQEAKGAMKRQGSGRSLAGGSTSHNNSKRNVFNELYSSSSEEITFTNEKFYPVGDNNNNNNEEAMLMNNHNHSSNSMIELGHNNGQTKIRRISSFSLLEVQTTEPMRFESSNSRSRSKDNTNNNNNHAATLFQQQYPSGCTSEEEGEFGAFAIDYDSHTDQPRSSNEVNNDNHSNQQDENNDYLISEQVPLSPGHDLMNCNTTNSSLAQTTFDGGIMMLKNAHNHSLLAQQGQQQIPQQGVGLTRVVSFNAFESPALYEVDSSNDRHFNRLKREKRKLSHAKSPEFQELKMNFAKEAIVKTIATHVKTTIK